MNAGGKVSSAEGPVGALALLPRETLGDSPGAVRETVLATALVVVSYSLGSVLGLSFRFPSTQISAIWPPNAILLAALLVTPWRRWWIYFAALLPFHLLVQTLMGIPFPVVWINFAGNAGDALLGALAILYFVKEPRGFEGLRTATVVMFFGGLLAPALISLAVAQLLAWADLGTDTWLAWRLRLMTNTFAVFTLVPPILLAAAKERTGRIGLSPRRSAEAGFLLAGLLAVGFLVFERQDVGSGESPILLYLPLPFLLWAAVRFGLVGVCLSVLTLGALSMWGAFNGHGPFADRNPVENATSLVVFLNFTCAPLLMLAALLAERESAEEGRQRAETLHSAVLASVHDHIAILDRYGLILEVNEAWSAAGCAAAGTNYLEVCRLAQRSNESVGRMLVGIEAVLGGVQTRFHMELAYNASLGAWFEMSAEGLKRSEGGVVITITDITGRKQAELEARAQRQELAHLTRVAMLGELSGALAHELNQPLTAILSNAQAAQRLMARDPVDLTEVRDILRDIAEDDRRAGEVIQRLRAMLKKGEVKPVPLDLNELAQEMLGLAHSDLITRNVTVSLQLVPGIPLVYGDRVQLQQVLLNLILNACEAMSARPAGQRRLTVATARDGDEGIQVSIVDRGTGIPADEVERVFEPFFTTKEHGLGLGLPICRSIVEAHGGRLWASNNEEIGATFYVTLPLHGTGPYEGLLPR